MKNSIKVILLGILCLFSSFEWKNPNEGVYPPMAICNLISIKGSDGSSSTFTYNDKGQIVKMKTNDLEMIYEYNADGTLAKRSSGDYVETFTWNLSSQTFTLKYEQEGTPFEQKYYLDKNKRLMKKEEIEQGQVSGGEQYTYDKNGNLKKLLSGPVSSDPSQISIFAYENYDDKPNPNYFPAYINANPDKVVSPNNVGTWKWGKYGADPLKINFDGQDDFQYEYDAQNLPSRIVYKRNGQVQSDTKYVYECK